MTRLKRLNQPLCHLLIVTIGLVVVTAHLRNVSGIFSLPTDHGEKVRTFFDYKTHFVAYKDLIESRCYLERIRNTTNNRLSQNKTNESRNLYISDIPLTKIQIWRLAGSRISEFCRGYPTLLLQETKPIHVAYNDDENELVEEINTGGIPQRLKRQTTTYFRGRRYKGQTQSQYLNIGNGQQPGKAEAESSPDGSRAVVSGNSGMGQAQSQSGSGGGCEDCYGTGYDAQSQALGYRPGGFGPGKPGEIIPGRFPGRRPPEGPDGVPAPLRPGELGLRPGQMIPGQLQPGQLPNGALRPGQLHPGAFHPGQILPGTMHPGQIIPGTMQPGQIIPGTMQPGQIIPGMLRPGDINGLRPGELSPGQIHPGGLRPGETFPGLRPGEIIPGLQPGHIQPGGLRPGETIPGLRPGETTPRLQPGQVHPGDFRPSETIPARPGEAFPGLRPGQIHPGGLRPGEIIPGLRPGETIPGQLSPGRLPSDRLQPGHVMIPGMVHPGQTPGRLQPGLQPSSGLQPGQIPSDLYPPGKVPTDTLGPELGPDPGYVPPGSPSDIYGPGRKPEHIDLEQQPGFGIPSIIPTGPPGRIADKVPQRPLGPGEIYGPAGEIIRQPTRSPGEHPWPPSQYIAGDGIPGRMSEVDIGARPSLIPGHVTAPGVDAYARPTGQFSYIPGRYPGAPGTITGRITTETEIHVHGGQVGYPFGGGPTGPDYLPGVRVPGTHIPGQYPGAKIPGIAPGEIPGQYPGAQIPEHVPATQIPGQYPGAQIPSQYPGAHIPGQYPGAQIPGQYPGTPSTQIPAQYPGAKIPGQYPGVPIPGQYPGAQIPEHYPGAQIPGQYPGQYPGTQIPGQYLGTEAPGAQMPGQYPGAQIPGQYPGTQIPAQYPGTRVPETQIPGQYPGTQIPEQYPGAQIPGQYPGAQIPGQFPGAQIPGHFPGQKPGTEIPRQFPDRQMPGQYHSVQIPGQYPGTQIPGQHPGAHIPGVQIPGVQIPGQYPGAQVPGAQIPGVQIPGTQIPGQYPGAQILGVQIPGTQIPGQYSGAQIPGAQIPGVQIPGAQIPGQYPGAQIPGTSIPGQRPGTPGWRPGQPGVEGQTPGTYQPNGAPYPIVDPSRQPGCTPGVVCEYPPGAEDADSQAQSSVQQVDKDIQASAASQGRYMGGTAQSQVSGTYSGTGSFSAQAGTIDGKRGAQTQVSGGKEGAMSSAQGNGGYGQSQSQVQLSADTGAATSGAQSSGWNHGTNTQVQADEKGGMADAQANGPGSTSSQAQIGFSPHDETEKDDQNTPFRGGGSASAQSGTFTGQSQSQIQGKFRYGIRYTGAAQAESGTKESLEKTQNQTIDGPIPPITPLRITEHKKPEQLPTATSESHKVSRSSLQQAPQHVSNSNNGETKPPRRMEPIPTQTTVHEMPSNPLINQPSKTDNQDKSDEMDYEYDDDYDSTPESDTGANTGDTRISQSTKSQKQHILLGPLEDLDAHVIQAKGDPELKEGMILQPGQVIPGMPGYQIPAGYRGRVTSVAYGDKTMAVGRDSQAQSVTITPGTGKIHYITPKSGFTQTRDGSYIPYTYYKSSQPAVRSSSIYPKFMTVTKSESGSKNLITGKKNPQVYYTQSSTCGFFTNTCVFSGAKKICIPKAKSNPDGTPMLC